MSLSTREANIARNDEFLRSMGITGSCNLALPKEGSAEAASSSSSRRKSVEEEDSSTSNMVKASDELSYSETKAELVQLTSLYPYRAVEINHIWGYLNAGFDHAPALLISGPTGCGKTDICVNIMERYRVPYVYFMCTGYSTTKKMLRALWHKLVSSLLVSSFSEAPNTNTNKRNQGASGSGSNSKVGSANVAYEEWIMRGPSTFGELSSALTQLLEASRTISNSRNNAQRARGNQNQNQTFPRLNIVFDRFDVLEALEKKLSHRLARLSEFCHESIKVVGILR